MRVCQWGDPGPRKEGSTEAVAALAKYVCTSHRNVVQLYTVVEVLAINRFVQSLHGFNQVRDDRNSANHVREEVIR